MPPGRLTLTRPCRQCGAEVALGELRCPHCDAPRPGDAAFAGEGREWKTTATWLSLPLLHLAWGMDSAGRPLRARGIIAIGQRATGGIAIGIMATGGVAVGFISFGVLSVGFVAIGAVAAAGFNAFAPWAAGVVAIGWSAAGVAALGWKVSSLLGR